MSYDKMFAIREIENSKVLQALYFAILASFFVTFYGWAERSTISISTFIKGTHVCPPYFQHCGDYYFLESLPYGYTQSFFYVILFVALLCGLVAGVKKDWITAHKILLPLFAWKVVFIFVLTYGVGGNFDYYDMALAFVWLFLGEKEYFARVVFVVLYFVASTIKIGEGWIFGNYLNSTILGAPFLSDRILPIFTNLVILMQMVGSWYLLSKKQTIQKVVFCYFLLFHMYSGVLVNYRYITISIPALVILFGHNFEYLRIATHTSFGALKISREAIWGYFFITFLLLSQSIGILIPGDQKKTLEGNFYGLYMFEANHQCTSVANIIYKNGTAHEVTTSNTIANNRCDPYQYWYVLKTLCNRDSTISRVGWTFDHSINGHHFERIVSEDNACLLEYKNLQHNSWIRRDGEAEVLTRPVFKNGYSRELYPESRGIKTSPIMSPTLSILEQIYWSMWLFALFFVSWSVLKRR